MKKIYLFVLLMASAMLFTTCKKMPELKVCKLELTSENVAYSQTSAEIKVEYDYPTSLQYINVTMSENSLFNPYLGVIAEVNDTAFIANFVDLHTGKKYYYKFEYSNGINEVTSEVHSFYLDAASVTLPTVQTKEVTDITNTSVICGGDITDDGGYYVTSRGVCWSTHINPTIFDSYTTDGMGTGPYTSTITGLTENTVYYVRAFAINEKGTSYGTEYSFETDSWSVSTETSMRNALFEIFSGRTCTYCPSGDAIANDIAAENPGRIWQMHIHSHNDFSPETYPNLITEDADVLDDGFNVYAYPTGVVNRDAATAYGREVWAEHTNEQLAQEAECNIAGRVTIDNATRKAHITVKIYYTANSGNSTNYLSVAMLQDNIIGSQTGASTYNPSQMVGDDYRHMHVLRDIITPTWGESFSPTTAGTLITKTFDYDIPEVIGDPEGAEVILDDIYFLAWVTNGASTSQILNCCKIELITE